MYVVLKSYCLAKTEDGINTCSNKINIDIITQLMKLDGGLTYSSSIWR